MKYLTPILLVALLCTALLPVSVAADTSAGNGSGYISVINPPVADFYTSVQYGPSPFTVSFADTSRGSLPMTYLWEFGDGASSAMQNPTHTYHYNGEYTVSLTVTNQYGSDTKTVADFIGAGFPPETNFSASPADGTIPLTVTFTDLSKNTPTDWKWDFGDGTTSSDQNPVHTYTLAGIYDVRLKVSSHFGSDALVRTHYINASRPAPVPVPTPVTLVKAHATGIVGLIQDAKGTTDKNLPTAAFIPPQFMALAAVLTSFGVIFVQFLLANISTIAQFGAKFAKFLADLAGGHAVEKISEKEIEARGIEAKKRERHFFGLSATELLVVEAAVIMVAVAFLLADRAALTLQMVLIYILVGAFSVILHDSAHRYFANRYGHDTDIQFWGLGTVIMFLTAWLYGNAFAQSYRNIVERDENADETRELGIEMVAGPVISIILMLVFLFMVQFGGVWAIAGGLGFTINLITAVYSLIPISTMDGSAIWKWNRPLFLVLFIPLIAFYFFTFMLV
ncbi:PKD domain-containing protein [Methanoregula sp.]|jgi:PKD repeat protein/Zn-dependent protease|uniref:PKD domain-containing protein n=1 Tax=Methanoregula sp. TaxID=2052170 RepID=UPI0025E1376D|nr:PKD domain-containing protein [Methanoregula sp.]